MAGLTSLGEAIQRGDQIAARRLTRSALQRGVAARVIIEAMSAAMEVIGKRFEDGQCFVPEMLVSAGAMKAAMALLEPVVSGPVFEAGHRAMIGTVFNDLHDLGKNLVAMMWQGADFEVIDLGVNVSPQQFVEAARDYEPDLVGISALLTTTLPTMRETVEALRQSGVADMRIMVGGAPVTQGFAHEIGADGYAPDAAAAVAVARRLVRVEV